MPRSIRFSYHLAFSAMLFAGVRPLGAQSTRNAPTCIDAAGPAMDSSQSTPAGAAAPRATAERDGNAPTLRILASASADEVRFVGQPRICVRLHGDARLDSTRVTARRNITSPVVSGTTYRNVYVAVEILGHIQASCIAARITGTAPDSTADCAAVQTSTRSTPSQSLPNVRPRR